MGSYSLLHNTVLAIGFFSSTENTTGSSNSSFGFDTLRSNTTGNNNSAFGYHALRNNTTGYNNTSLGSASGQSMLATVGSTCIGTNADTAFSYSTAIGSNSVCTADHQIMLGTENETVFIRGKTTMEGDMNISNTMLVKGGAINETTINGSISLAGDVGISGDLAIRSGANSFTVNSTSTFEFPTNFNSTTTFNQAMTFTNTLNDVTSTTFNFLKKVSSDIQSQLNSLKTTTIDISWISGTINRTDIRNACSTSILTFSQSLNSISATTFGYLANATSDIQIKLIRSIMLI